MDFNTQNQIPNQGAPSGNVGKKANPLVLVAVAIAVLALVVATYAYMRGWENDYFPGLMMDDYNIIMDKMMNDERTESTDAGPEIMLDKDTTGDIQGDLDKTMMEDVDKQFMEVDKDLQNL